MFGAASASAHRHRSLRPIAGVPAVDARGQGGLLDVALSPGFASNRAIFWSYRAALGRQRHQRRARQARTEEAAQPGSDGLVIMPDGTKHVSSVTQGGVSRIRPGAPAELIARNIPTCRVDVLRCGRQPAGDPDEPAQRPCVRAARVIGGSRQRTSRARRVQTCSP
jgi:hypothetical protein